MADQFVRRPSAPLTRELLESVVALVEEGNWPTVAARSLGVKRTTFETWINRGDHYDRVVENGGEDVPKTDHQALCHELYVRVSEAEARNEVDLLHGLRAAVEANKYYQGYAHLLARRYPERWEKRDVVSGQGKTFEDQVREYMRQADAVKA